MLSSYLSICLSALYLLDHKVKVISFRLRLTKRCCSPLMTWYVETPSNSLISGSLFRSVCQSIHISECIQIFTLLLLLHSTSWVDNVSAPYVETGLTADHRTEYRGTSHEFVQRLRYGILFPILALFINFAENKCFWPVKQKQRRSSNRKNFIVDPADTKKSFQLHKGGEDWIATTYQRDPSSN